ncbi:MAG: cation:proton antiporter [Mycobacteriales bacterium]
MLNAAFDHTGVVLHLTIALILILAVARLGGLVARWLGQPTVVGEIAAGMLIVPVMLASTGTARERLLPTNVVEGLRFCGEVGLALYLVGIAHEIRLDRLGPNAGGWITAGSLILPLLSGAALAGWIVWTDNEALRGTAPTAAFTVMLAVSLAITAVPVLSRILASRKMITTPVGQLAMAAALSIDVVAWLLLAAAIALAAGGVGGILGTATVLVAGTLAAIGLARLLFTGTARRLASRYPRGAAIGLGTTAVAAGILTEHHGVTIVFGATLVGLAVCGKGSDNPWTAAVHKSAALGHLLVPAFFVVSGAWMIPADWSTLPWVALAVAVALAIAGKAGGSYLGARLAGQDHWTGLRLAALMNTRGLTEIVVLQAGLAAGLITSGLFFALVMMALVTTVITGPALSAIERFAPPRHTAWSARN